MIFLLSLTNTESEANPNNNLMMRKAGLYKKKATVVVSPSYSYDYLVGPLADHVFLQYLMGLSIYCVAVNVLDATRNVKTDSRSRIIC